MRCCGSPSCQHALVAGNGMSVEGSGAPGDPWVIDRQKGPWRVDVPSPVFSGGVTITSGEFFDLRWRRTPDSAGYELDYQGAFRLGASSAVTGSISITIPGSHAVQAGVYAIAGDVTLYDRSVAPRGAFYFAAPAATVITLFRDPAGYISATAPFIWAPGDVIRWNVRGLLVT